MNLWLFTTYNSFISFDGQLFFWSSRGVCKKIAVCYCYFVMLTTKKKQDVIAGVQTHDSDTGSPQVQIALLSGRITELTEHLKVHKKDIHSRRGLIKMVDTRRKLLRNFKNKDLVAYQNLIQKLGLKK